VSDSPGVHNRLKQLRTERGVSRRELADALGVHYQTVGYLERGEYNPSLHLAHEVVDLDGDRTGRPEQPRGG
jgi:putative transcriptional regulator